VNSLAKGVLDGDRRSLARAITLAESTRVDHRTDAEELLAELLPHTGGAVRIGISGAPGAGKSTFIEALGLHLIERGHRVAVLAVDPSSTRSGGSILGDKTRMEQLTRAADAFVRPSPTGGTLGGVARRTREVLLLCEAAAFDVVLVETVGVGQSEVAVAAMVDLFLVLVSPGGGDELQGIKRGIMELADLVVVNKADGDLAAAAATTASDYAAALHLVRPRTPAWSPHVLTCSALRGIGIVEVWTAIEAYCAAVESELDDRRADQAQSWMWSEVTETLVASLRADPAVADLAARLEADVAAGSVTPTAAAQAVLQAFLHGELKEP
jgi:LAO/AO transport system kinase